MRNLMNYSESDLEKTLMKHNINITSQRINILKYLLQNSLHPSSEEIYEALKNKFELSRATVYNTMNLFEEKELVRVVDIVEGIKRYDLLMHDHAHFLCVICGNIDDVNTPDSINNGSVFTLPSDYTIERIDILIRGICGKCSSMTNSKIQDSNED